MNGRKTVSYENMNVGNNIVKFVDNLPFNYFEAPQKQQRLDGKSNQQLNIIQNTPSH